MAELTTDPKDPRLGHGTDDKPRPQQEVYLVLSEEERAEGFVRPYRDTYKHVGRPKPNNPLLDLTPEQQANFGDYYVKFEAYPPDDLPKTGRYWTQAEIDEIDKGCGGVTTMGRELSETYARNPGFYGATYCASCQMHKPVHEFVWTADGERVGS